MDNLECQLQQAHLLCVRREFDEAEHLLKELNRTYPGSAEVRHLLQRLAATKRLEEQDNEKRREWRYYLRLQTSWQRFLWGAAGVVGVLYGMWGLVDRLPRCFHMGFAAEITTRVYQSGGRYRSGRWADWTRPLYYDILYYSLMAIVGTIVIWILWKVSRGATQWEELDAPLPENSRYAGW